MKNALEGLNPEQQQVVLATHGPVLVLAGAGSGKTRALTHRIAHLIGSGAASPQEILAVTFTNKAAAEMRHRLEQLLGSHQLIPKSVSTFHSMGVKILREQIGFHERSSSFSIMDTKDSEKLVRKALRDKQYSLKEWTPSAVRGMISKLKHEYVDIPPIGSPQTPAEEVLSVIYPMYESALAEHNAYDFDDLLRIPLRMLRLYPHVRTYYQSRWKFVSVDEYQDTNSMQEEIISLLLGAQRNICVVGDDYQSIYSWRGAHVDRILEFEQRNPGCTTILLTQNYRSTPNILQAANTVIAENRAQKHKTLWTDKKSGSEVVHMRLLSDRAEAMWVCDRIESHMRSGGSLKDCAVLYRTNAQSRLLEEQFLLRKIPYTIVGGFRFYERKEIKDALSILSFYLAPTARIHFERIADALLHRVGPKTIDRWSKLAQGNGTSLGEYLAGLNERRDLSGIMKAFTHAKQTSYDHVSDLLKDLLTNTGYIASLAMLPDGKEREENIEELLNVAAAYTSPESFLEDTALLSDIDTNDASSNRVTCMTLHASKGLEFPHVWIIGCEEGLLPHGNSIDSSASIEEERRLLYVGMTRAREQLTLTHSAYRFQGGEMAPRTPSRFLEKFPAVQEGGSQNNFPVHDEIVDEMSDFIHQEPTLVQPTSGSYVSHPKLGRGVIIGISGNFLTCVFEGHGVKSVAADTCTRSL